ncbi:MAG: DinB family protein [Ekhidna sp.]
MEVNFEYLLQQSNQMKNYIERNVSALSVEKLNWKESPKKWSVLEVVSHLNKVYNKYHENFEQAISDAPKTDTDRQRMQRTILGRMSIYSMKPKGKKRKFKMKTFNFFEPQIDKKNVNVTLHLFLNNKDRFNSYLKESRSKKLDDIKIPTALGEKMKFYIPECFEFILAHEERHMVQIKEIIEKTT